MCDAANIPMKEPRDLLSSLLLLPALCLMNDVFGLLPDRKLTKDFMLPFLLLSWASLLFLSEGRAKPSACATNKPTCLFRARAE